MPIEDMEVTFEGETITGQGRILLSFVAPYSEVSSYVRLVMYVKKQVYVFAKWQSIDDEKPVERDEQLGVFTLSRANIDLEEGECLIKLRTDVNSVFDDVLSILKRDCVKGVTGDAKTVQLSVYNSDEAAALTSTP